MLNTDEALMLSLIESYADLNDSEFLKTLLKQYKRNKIYVAGRVRAELLAVARALRISILQQGRAGRGIQPLSAEDLEKLLGGESE